MTTRCSVSLALLCAGVFALAQPAAAQQTINFSIGYFALQGADGRVDDDVLNVNSDIFRKVGTEELLSPGDFNSLYIGGEWLVALGEYLEAGAGIAYTQRTVATSYDQWLDEDGFEIEQDLRLRTVPIAFTARAVPLGQRTPIQPYVGAGLLVIPWKYSEVGDFIDETFDPPEIFTDEFVASGTETGPILLFGLRFAGETFTVGGEVRRQWADASLPPGEFYGTALDLGGWTYLANVGVRFGGR